jgi:hypothetical protein
MRCRLASSRSFAAQIQPFFAVNAICPLVIVAPAFASQQDLKAREPITYPCLRNLSDPLPHGAIVAPVFTVLKHRSRQQHHRAGFAF